LNAHSILMSVRTARVGQQGAKAKCAYVSHVPLEFERSSLWFWNSINELRSDCELKKAGRNAACAPAIEEIRNTQPGH
jgi:hypothetical protein